MAAVRQKILAVSGVKNSGKTTLLEKLIPALTRRGLRAAVLKHDGHRFAADRPGTDTFRLLGAGAAGAAIYDGEKFQAVKYAAVTEGDLAALYPDADLILLEGFKDSAYPKIEVVAPDKQPVCSPATLLAMAADGDAELPGVPKLSRNNADGLADLIYAYWEGGTMEAKLTHFDEQGRAIMVDVTQKPETDRTAIAKGRIRMAPETLRAIRGGTAAKGDVLGVARVAGIMAAKRTGELIPLCHPLPLGKCAIEFRMDETAGEVEAVCTASLRGQTGVEMEALTGVSVSLLTIYDMCKAIDRRMEITGVHLAKKAGGKSGLFVNDPEFET